MMPAIAVTVAAKRGRVEGEAKEGQSIAGPSSSLQMTMAQLIMQSTQQSREVKGMLVEVIKINADAEWETSHKKGTKEFMKKQKSMKEEGMEQSQIKAALGIPE
eukprot:7612504-Karenia_brevis.AAC.1